MKNQPPEICWEAEQKDGHALQYVTIPTTEICLAALQQNGLALQYLEQPTEEMCLVAVQQNGQALRYVKRWLTPEIVRAAQSFFDKEKP